MKKIVMFIVFMAVMSFSQSMDSLSVVNWIGRVESSNSNNILMFSFNTKWRINFDVSEFDGVSYPDFSKVNIVINNDKGIGYLWDETETIMSFYKIEDIKIYDGLKGNYTLITGLLTSNVGNQYTMMMNDYNKSFVLSGEMGTVVIRRMYNIQ